MLIMGNSSGFDESVSKVSKVKSQKRSKFKKENQSTKDSSDDEVLLSLPAGLKYRLPGKRQRVVIGSLVIGLNVLLVIAVIIYFYNPDFQSFIYNVGRD